MAKRGKVNRDFETVRDLDRPSRIRKYKYLFLIICEDENTEKVYFSSFQVRIPKDSIYLETVGTGLDPLGIVKQTLVELAKLQEFSRRQVDEVWLVFDKDDANLNATRIKRFNDAFKIAVDHNFKMAYSNEVFELWLLLHLIDVNPENALSRGEIYQMLAEEIRKHNGYENFEYEHGNENVLEVIAEIGDEQAAISRAERLIGHHGSNDPIDSNPVTYVGRLILELYGLINYFAYE